MSEFSQAKVPDAAMPEPQPIRTGGVNADTVNIGDQSNNVNINNFNFLKEINELFDDDGRRTSARRFAETDACPYTDEREEELKALYVGDAALTDSLIAVLERERVLFLAGERGIGKQTTALYIATRIADAHDLENSTSLIAPLEEQVHFEFRNVSADPKFRRRVIVLDDALATKNVSLLDIFGKLERVSCDRLAGELVRSDAYLIVTVADVDLRPFRQQLGSHVHVRDLGALPSHLVEEGYRRKVQWVAKVSPEKAAHVEQLTTKQERVVDTLKTLARIASFADFYVKRVDPDLQGALDDYSDDGRWFQTSLAGDFDAWCCALALVLAQATSLGDKVAWLDFERLRREIADRLKSDEELFPPWRNRDRGWARRTSAEFLDDDALRIGAQVETTSDGSGHTVSFSEPVKAADLWK